MQNTATVLKSDMRSSEEILVSNRIHKIKKSG